VQVAHDVFQAGVLEQQAGAGRGRHGDWYRRGLRGRARLRLAQRRQGLGELGRADAGEFLAAGGLGPCPRAPFPPGSPKWIRCWPGGDFSWR